MIAPKILFEDPQILVIEKPSGVVVNRAKTVKEETVQDWIENKLKTRFSTPHAGEKTSDKVASNSKLDFRPRDSRGRKIATQSRQTTTQNLKLAKYKEFYDRSGIVHRLDKETSGLLVIAKTPKAFASLKSQFISRQIKKKYLALVHGKMEAREGEIYLPIKRLPWDRKKFGIIPAGKKARTKYKLITNYHFSQENLLKASLLITNFSLLEIEPETGRTHQIRVHLKHLGHPIVGDSLYGGRRAKKDRIWCPRLFLHASYLSFTHPQTGKKMEFKSPLSQDLEEILSGLKKA